MQPVELTNTNTVELSDFFCEIDGVIPITYQEKTTNYDMDGEILNSILEKFDSALKHLAD